LPAIPWWWLFPAYLSLAAAGVFLLLRAAHWHLSRRFFLASMLGCIYFASELVPWSAEYMAIGAVAQPGAMALALSLAAEWTRSAPGLRSWQRLVPWAVALLQAGSLLAWRVFTWPTGAWPFRLVLANGVVLLVLALGYLARAYSGSGDLERRQLRWVLYGFYVGFLPYILFLVGLSAGLEIDYVAWQAAADIALVAIPGGIVVSVVAYQYLDIDRLISASASLTLVAVVLIAGVVSAVPHLARATSVAVGIGPEASQFALSLTLAVLLVPAYQALRPWIDRGLFAGHHALVRAFEGLLADLSECTGVEELATRGGRGIDQLLRPDSIATYAGTGDAFAPVFVRGPIAPPAFAAESALVRVLEERGAAIVARTKELSPFDRATLETLGAEVVIPVRRNDRLVAFTCLAGKRSGDIYTPTDVALLAAVAERCSEVIGRLEAAAVARESERVQASLRRYVPGAVAERLLVGDPLEPEEREVTVLFVDIRDYTAVAEGLQPRDVFTTLNQHTERVSRIIQDEGGTIVEFNGDGMMTVFGAPSPQPRKELQAVEAARRIVDSMRDTLSVGVGIATGRAFVGSIRSSDRLIWTAVGSTTNLASRLQTLTRTLDASIAIDETTRARAGYVCADFARHAAVEIRGRRGPMQVFALPTAKRPA
jgi:class 3 adenylate cyclase